MLIASRNRLARLHYGPNGFRALSPGDHVLCAVSGVPIGLEELGAKLKAVAAARGGMDEPIFVRGDKATEYGSVARVMARIKEAGFKKLSLVTESEAGG